VVRFSRKRILGRLQSSKLKRPYYKGGHDSFPLYERIERLSNTLKCRAIHLTQVSDLQAALMDLVESLKNVDLKPLDDDLELLKTVVLKCHGISNKGNSKLLEKSLCVFGFGKDVTERRAVLEIDKLGKYFGLCKDLIHFGRQSKTRLLWQNLRLETCTSYPSSTPCGSREFCFVHAEVQLILFYERFPKQPPEQTPRAIGSSKSACFLCDYFIRNYGSFGVSHSHMQLFTQWTIPEATWMSVEQVQRMRIIIRAIDKEVPKLLEQNIVYNRPGIQSRANLLLVESSTTEPSIASPQLSETRLGADISLQRINPTHSSLDYASSPMPQSELYYLQDLPITINVSPCTSSCTLLCGKVDYIFDLEEVQQGQLLITTVEEKGEDAGHRRVDVRQLVSSSPLTICSEENSQSFSISTHDADKHEIYMTFIWLSK
jgi:hypothetical protein